MIHKWGIPSFRCKASLNRSTAMRLLDGLILIFTDFYVPAFTPRLH
jgi:hypothetical protein